MKDTSRMGKGRLPGAGAAVTWLVMISVLISVSALAQNEPPQVMTETLADETPVARPSLKTMSPEQAARLSPLMKEMREILLEEDTLLEPLEEAYGEVSDSREAFRIQRQIAAIRNQTEIALLTAQVENFRARGMEDKALHLQESIAFLEDPQANAPTSDPVPRSSDGRAIRP